MNRRRVLHQLRRLPRPLQPLIVAALPVLQWVEPSHEHRRRREIQPGNIDGVGPTNVGGPVVQIQPVWQKCPPHPLGPIQRHNRSPLELDLGLGPLFTPKKRLNVDQPNYLEVRELSPASPDNDVVGDVPAGAVSGDKALGDVSGFRPFGDLPAAAVEEGEDVESVVVLGGELMFGAETVLDGANDGV
uniref:Uncharacterized protein n=1 Tax=Opuntia streptacantha TaxID=393608 RepID=A0A7C8YG11_OPUST